MTSQQNTLNEEVHTKVFGNPFDSACTKDYVGDYNLLREVIDEMIKQDYSLELDHDEEGWKARFYKDDVLDPFGPYSRITMNESVCQAAVAACDLHNKGLVKLDYSQLEAKVLANTVDPNLFGRGIDWRFGYSIYEDKPSMYDKEFQATVDEADRLMKEAQRQVGMSPSLGAPYGLAASTAHIKNDVNEYLKPGIRHGEGYTDYLYAMKWVPHNHQQNQTVTDDKVQANPIQNNIVKSIPCTQPWMHSWETYQGLNDKFDYCTKCDEKRKDKQ